LNKERQAQLEEAAVYAAEEVSLGDACGGVVKWRGSKSEEMRDLEAKLKAAYSNKEGRRTWKRRRRMRQRMSLERY
jgi:hypothetical protein